MRKNKNDLRRPIFLKEEGNYSSGWIQDLPDGGANPWRGGKNLLFGKIFAKSCIKMKEIGPGGHASLAPSPPPPTHTHIRQCIGFGTLHRLQLCTHFSSKEGVRLCKKYIFIPRKPVSTETRYFKRSVSFPCKWTFVILPFFEKVLGLWTTPLNKSRPDP